MRPQPVMRASAGTAPTRGPSSRNVPGSSRCSMRSRAVRLPRSCCFAIFSGPPISLAAALRAARSSSRSAHSFTYTPLRSWSRRLPTMALRPASGAHGIDGREELLDRRTGAGDALVGVAGEATQLTRVAPELLGSRPERLERFGQLREGLLGRARVELVDAHAGELLRELTCHRHGSRDQLLAAVGRTG